MGHDFMVQTGLYQIPEQNVAVHGKYVYTLTPPSRAWLHSRCNSETPSDTHRMQPAEPATSGFHPVPVCTSESSGVSRMVGSVKPQDGLPSVPLCTPQAGGASTLTRSTEPDSAPKQASVATPMNAASRSFTRTPASSSPICRVCETAIIPPFTDCTLPVSVPSTAGAVLVLPEGVREHGLVALPALFEALDGQFWLHLINANETPVRLEHATRVLDCEVTHLPVVVLDEHVPALHTSVTPTHDRPTPTTPVASEPSMSVIPPVDVKKGTAILEKLFNEFPQLFSPVCPISQDSNTSFTDRKELSPRTFLHIACPIAVDRPSVSK